MKKPDEIKELAEKQFTNFLQSLITNEEFFPLNIPVGYQNTTRSIREIDNDISLLQQNGKLLKGFGYELEISQRNYSKYGLNPYVESIFFSNETDYIRFIKREKDVSVFRKYYPIIVNSFPVLKEWLLRKPEKVIENASEWENLLKICQYFVQNPRPNLYIRQLPIKNIHTKFIEENKPILTSLLNWILPKDAINEDTKDFEKRFGLLESVPLIRFRILDKNLFINNLSDISLPISQFETLFIQDKIDNIFIAENQMCILTFPEIPKSIIIFGSGAAVNNLSKISWIKNQSIYYWGDLDVEGFSILSQLRAFKTNAISLMMDLECLDRFSEEGLSKGKDSVRKIPLYLSENETELFNHLKTLPIDRCRFEQEKIPQWYVEEQLSLIQPTTQTPLKFYPLP